MHFDFLLHLFSVGGHMSSYVNFLGGRCHLMTFFIGGHMSGGGGKCPTLIYIIVDFQDSAAQILTLILSV